MLNFVGLNAPFVRDVGTLLGLVCAQWTFLTMASESTLGIEPKYLRQPHATQILGILRLLCVDQANVHNNLIQINTGEGKSIALGFTSIMLALLGHSVDVVCYNEYLSIRDEKAFNSLFQWLALGDNITYSNFDGLFSRILTTNSEVKDVRQYYDHFCRKTK